MSAMEPDRYSDEECANTFRKLFPHGFAGPEVIAEIAPEGWACSPLVAIFHPSLEQVFQEATEVYQNLKSLRQFAPKLDESPPTLEEVRKQFTETPSDSLREPAELVGRCLWDIFSDNHEVRGPDGRVFDIGSFRGAGQFIADELNRQINQTRYGYLDFFMGTSWIVCRADVTVVYKMLFNRLRGQRLDWVYHFPRLNLIHLEPLGESLKLNDHPEWIDYDPESALARERDELERQQQLAEMQRRMDEDHARVVEDARAGPPPKTVLAYRSVYGRFPLGWPP